jgi:hypothetical protein
MTKRADPNRHVLNLVLMKIRLVSASGLLFFSFEQTQLSSPSLPTAPGPDPGRGRQAQDVVFRCNLNKIKNWGLIGRMDFSSGDV